MHTQDNSLGRATNFSLPNSTNSIGDQSLNHLNDANAAVSELPSSSLGRVSQARVGGPRRRSRSRSPVRMPNSTSLPAESPWDWSDGGVPNPTTHQACIPGPFQGDFAGSSWNATALFASKAHRQRPKMRKTIQVVSKHDFLVVQEAHCLEGRADALQLPAEFTAFWSDCTAKAAGIGILLKRDFLSRFNAVVKSRDWIEIIPGYVAILKLHGPECNLDIFDVIIPLATPRPLPIDKMFHRLSANTSLHKKKFSPFCVGTSILWSTRWTGGISRGLFGVAERTPTKRHFPKIKSVALGG